MGITVRPATEADHDWLFQLHEDAHKELVEAAYGPWDPEQQGHFFAPLVGDHDVHVIEQDAKPVGGLYLGARGNDLWLELIEVRSEYQNEGIGSAGLRWVLEEAAKAHRGTLLQVHKMNTSARRLYERLGFVRFEDTETHHLLRHA
ncbi:GNAT family N-acetyltransferase [Curtobacterium sp. MCPF17_046]|uniref:GNAT family N-acetyltransferase n=1 Tax=Curtobacterium sp. MCPF17_046 TaxID=2175663 RepID=UPI000D903B82|nr:GNAT family N-acetyltransferase [Curtobacterium sp. MCPF17_046]PYY38996.1 hypothetical protein DEJ32_10000 [Curtobacterium sp. MCPF17_046]